MSTITFDTLKFSQRLEQAGATREYAIAEAQALAEIFETSTRELVTKGDLQIELAPIRSELILLKWMVGLSLALSTGMIALLVRIAFSLPH